VHKHTLMDPAELLAYLSENPRATYRQMAAHFAVSIGTIQRTRARIEAKPLPDRLVERPQFTQHNPSR